MCLPVGALIPRLTSGKAAAPRAAGMGCRAQYRSSSMATKEDRNCDPGSTAARRSRQYLAAAVVNIAGFMSGSAYGWTAPILPLLQSPDSPLGIPPITETYASWLASVINIARIFVTPAFLYINDWYGRKITGYIIAAMCILSWAMILFANSIATVFAGRAIIGIASAGIVLLVPSFTSDFAEDDIKGQLAAVFGLSMNLGATFSYAMGSFTSFTVYHISGLLVPVFFIGTFFWLPESPLFLMAKGKPIEAKESLQWFRNGRDSEFELDRIRIRAKEVMEKRNKKMTCSCSYDKATIRALLITIGLLTNKQLSGVTVITTYTVTIFQESGSVMSPSLSTVVIGLILTLGTLLSTLVVEKAGRRPLLLYTDIFIGACLAIMGTFLYLRGRGWATEHMGWLPIVCLSLYILGMSLALGPLTFTIATEMVSADVRGAVQTLCSTYGALVAFVSTMAYAPLSQAVGQHGSFWLFAGVCFVGAACIYLVMPETRYRSVEDVVEQLRSDHYVRSVLRGRQAQLDKSTTEPC